MSTSPTGRSHVKKWFSCGKQPLQRNKVKCGNLPLPRDRNTVTYSDVATNYGEVLHYPMKNTALIAQSCAVVQCTSALPTANRTHKGRRQSFGVVANLSHSPTQGAATVARICLRFALVQTNVTVGISLHIFGQAVEPIIPLVTVKGCISEYIGVGHFPAW